MPENKTTESDWVVSVHLGDVDGVAADAWMDAILEAVYARDPGFSGVVTMRKEDQPHAE